MREFVAQWVEQHAPGVAWSVDDIPGRSGIQLRLPQEPAQTYQINPKPSIPLSSSHKESIESFLIRHVIERSGK
jgi:hypothetical protein